MNIDCIFDILLYSEQFVISKCLVTCIVVNQLNTEYLWKLLYERDYKIDTLTNKSWNCKYLLYTNLNKINNTLNLNYDLYP